MHCGVISCKRQRICRQKAGNTRKWALQTLNQWMLTGISKKWTVKHLQSSLLSDTFWNITSFGCFFQVMNFFPEISWKAYQQGYTVLVFLLHYSAVASEWANVSFTWGLAPINCKNMLVRFSCMQHSRNICRSWKYSWIFWSSKIILPVPHYHFSMLHVQ